MRFLFIIFSLFAFANAQYYNVDLNNGIAEFTDTTSSFIKYSFTAQEISYREVGLNNFDICDNAFCNGFAMKEISNFTNRSYLLDSLNYWQSISGSSFSGLWQTTNGYYEPKTSKPFNFTYQGFTLLNDSIDFGVFKLPFVGASAGDLGTYKSLIGFGDATGIGGDYAHLYGYVDLFGERYNAIEAIDSSSISLRNDTTKATLNANGLVLPKMGAEPSGEPGSVYFNQNTTEFRAYNGSQFRTIVTLSGGDGSPIGVVTPAHEGIMFWDTGTNHIYISVGTTSNDWVKLH